MTEPVGNRRWDPVVRLTHWSVALAVLLNAAVTREGADAHVIVGYALAAMLALRLLWGLVGPPEARFRAFPPSPARALAHLRDIVGGRQVRHRSHNPLGALMAYALWACLAVIVATGIAMAGPPGAARPPMAGTAVAQPPPSQIGKLSDDREAGEEGEKGENGEEGEEGPLGEVHEAAVKLLYGLVLLHIAGVLFETRRSGAHVLLAMLPGRR